MAALSGKRRIWLTGATSGIGRALAVELLDQGHLVALSGRNESTLEALCKGRENALPVPLDVTDSDAVAIAGHHIGDLFGHLDVAILNAGSCEYLDARQLDTALVERVFATNFFGTIYCVRAALPLLRRACELGSRPLLAATSSASAYLALPRAEAYGASKAALSYFLESLRLDLASEAIDISLIHPGFVATPLTERNDFPMPLRVSAEAAANAIVAGLEKRRLDIHFPRRFTFTLRLLGLLPPAMRLVLGKRLVRHPASEY
ncbi:SDR family NAD(P)-dependent oxidoreductase [Billgrantia diversa]|uniref:SDR family NAD(P)-dependent oxidoreductase n=1 Tax=Halomonas sp. MCCC 1A13316 TaxID=2733487 RepID=UPI0018A429A4|nr:SDR family NAD(P)-dependent oxidoreductase [Halomonas sp. MCCC 1A13316]QOR40200.1 SDR family NAD(P)-dependent oxidoreductase [Halomonas sp. MCCC 1A13316]